MRPTECRYNPNETSARLAVEGFAEINKKALLAEGLGQTANRTRAKKAGSRSRAVVCSHEDDRRPMARCGQLALKFNPSHFRHLDVCDYA